VKFGRVVFKIHERTGVRTAHRKTSQPSLSQRRSNAAADVGDVTELIEGLEQLVMEEHYEVEIEMNFKWKTQHRLLAEETAASKQGATII